MKVYAFDILNTPRIHCVILIFTSSTDPYEPVPNCLPVGLPSTTKRARFRSFRIARSCLCLWAIWSSRGCVGGAAHETKDNSIATPLCRLIVSWVFVYLRSKWSSRDRLNIMAYQQGPPGGGGYPPAYQKQQQQPAGYPPQPGHTTIIVQQQPKVVTQPVVRSVSQW